MSDFSFNLNRIYTEEYREEFRQEIREEAAKKRYMKELMRNPDCRDPEHPGCDKCEQPDD